jgi:hypothetical protein
LCLQTIKPLEERHHVWVPRAPVALDLYRSTTRGYSLGLPLCYVKISIAIHRRVLF